MAAANGSMSMHQKGPQKEVAIQMSPGCRPSCLPFFEAYRKRFNYNCRLTKQYLHVLSIFIGTLPTAKCHFRPNRNRGPHPALICSHLADVPSRRWDSGSREAKRLNPELLQKFVDPSQATKELHALQEIVDSSRGS